MMNLVERQMLAQAQLADKHDDVQAKGKAGQCSGIRCNASVIAHRCLAVRVGTPIPTMKDFEGTFQWDDTAV
jgi:hypothetical protein